MASSRRPCTRRLCSRWHPHCTWRSRAFPNDPGLSALVTAVGLVLAVGGVGCGVWAYIQAVKQHDTLPVWPWANRQIQRVREWRPFKRDARQGSGTATIALAGSAIGRGEACGALTVVKGDETVEERIERRLQHAEKRAAEDRARADEADARISQQLTDQEHRFDKADEQLRQLTKSVAVSTARLQLVGLILVGLGTAVMALPTLFAAL
jgi:hypothetical protein